MVPSSMRIGLGGWAAGTRGASRFDLGGGGEGSAGRAPIDLYLGRDFSPPNKLAARPL